MDPVEDENIAEMHGTMQASLSKKKLDSIDILKLCAKCDKKDHGVIKTDDFEKIILPNN